MDDVSTATCPRCGAPAERLVAVTLEPTYRPNGPEIVLHRWVCASCGTRSVLADGPQGLRVSPLTGALLRHATAVSRDLADEVAPDRRVAGHLRRGWLCQAVRDLDGASAPPLPGAGQTAVDAALDRLRAIDWEPTIGTEQLELVRRHFDAVAVWVRAARAPHLWPGLQPSALVRDSTFLVDSALHRLEGEPWYAGLPSWAPARRDLAYWLVWLELDAVGDVPVTLPDPYEPLVRAYETGGVVLTSRELSNELYLGTVTLRLPDSVDDWPTVELGLRESLYVCDC